MAASVMASSLSLKPAPFTVEKSAARGLPSLAKTSFKIVAKGGKIKTDKPYGVNGGMDLREGLDASGRKAKYKFLNQQPLNSGELFVYIFGERCLPIC
ncbi:hypothetical protein CISIN_1g032633mg [Citrus sinensis]|uniref:Photosystem II 10 kDa polypeptide, chloroplastic n=1 Tax=Citrus sinensis TaxID=2711 RepID=A0A067EQD4_CITSI|nr:hypothetical protein CISIN_1g032633mg [Citrus sinensis]